MTDFVVDANPHKQNKYLPASHIPVMNEDYIKTKKPDFILILPWNIKDEIKAQLSYVKEWGGQFVVAV
ncbi:MAG: SAM-dependent methyltransferase, partial [Chloroherpetonaceae bacterium]